MLFSKNYSEDEIIKLIGQFRKDYRDSLYDISGNYYHIKVDEYFDHEDDVIRNGCLDIFGVKLLAMIEQADSIEFDESYVRIINSLLTMRSKKRLRVLLLINYIEYFFKTINEDFYWIGEDGLKRKEQKIYQKSKELFNKIKQLEIHVTKEEMELIEHNLKVIDIYGEFYLDALK